MISYEELSLVIDMEHPLTLEYFEICNSSTDEMVHVENHHILPRSMFKHLANKEKNIVKLLYKYHYRVHEILPLICLQKRHRFQMIRAWNTMHRIKDKEVDAETYGTLKALAKELVVRGEVHHSYGKSPHNKGISPSEETRRKQSEAQSGEKHRLWGKKHTSETIDHMKETRRINGHPMYGRKRTKESLEKFVKIMTRPLDIDYLTSRGLQYLSGEYTNEKSIVTFTCDRGHTFENSIYAIRARKSPCKHCAKEDARKQFEIETARIIEEMNKTGKKVCSCCGEVKNLSDFRKHSGRRDGYSEKCKECLNVAT